LTVREVAFHVRLALLEANVTFRAVEAIPVCVGYGQSREFFFKYGESGNGFVVNEPHVDTRVDVPSARVLAGCACAERCAKNGNEKKTNH
jgi:hypothetical protein